MAEEILIDEYTHFSDSLIYSPSLLPGPGANLTEFNSQLAGCECNATIPCVNSNNCECIRFCGQNYTSGGSILDDKWGTGGVVECNSQCLCGLSCSNRIVQFGPRKGLEMFDCKNNKGIGLKTVLDIPKGTFICEYAGEVIDLTEAKKRFKIINDMDSMNYIFVLREILTSNEFKIIETVVDPSFIGNIGRYINHSCDPNAGVIPVRIDCPIPKLCIFAKTDIKAGEEVTYDYSGGKQQPYELTNVQKCCLCEAPTCKGFLPVDSSLLS